MSVKLCVFDAYGTLFDINSAARRCATEPGREQFSEIWPSISASWREKQLSYSWLLNILNKYSDFWEITENALDYALQSVGLETDSGLRDRLLNLYKELDTYDEVKLTLSKLRERKITCAILSNGSKSMLNSAVESSGIGHNLHSVLSVDEIRIYKPDPQVYKMVLTHMPFKMDEILFVSSNGWDIAGAASFGFKTIWVNRFGLPLEKLPFKPDAVLSDLTSIEKYI